MVISHILMKKINSKSTYQWINTRKNQQNNSFKNKHYQNEKLKQNFMKKLLKKEKTEPLVINNIKAKAGLLIEIEKKNKDLISFASPDITINKNYNDISRSKTKEKQITKSGNSFFKYSINKMKKRVNHVNNMNKPTLR